MTPLREKLEVLTAERGELKSRAFIAENGIKKSDVEMSEGDGKPNFNTMHEFCDWVRSQPGPSKQWMEWNGNIYRRDDLMVGNMPQTGMRVKHLED